MYCGGLDRQNAYKPCNKIAKKYTNIKYELTIWPTNGKTKNYTTQAQMSKTKKLKKNRTNPI